MSFGTIPPHHPNPKPALAIRLMSWNQVNQLPEVVSRFFFNPHQSLEFGADKFIRTNLLYISRLYIRKTLASPKVSNGTLRSVEVSIRTRLQVLYEESITINPVTSTAESAHGVSWCAEIGPFLLIFVDFNHSRLTSIRSPLKFQNVIPHRVFVQ